MANTKQLQHTVTIGGKEYKQPKMGVNAYLRYLEVRDSIMQTEGHSGLYTAQQFRDVMNCIVEMYGNQFTVEEMIDEETGLTVDQIMFEFAAIEVGIAQNVNNNVEQMQANFQKAE